MSVQSQVSQGIKVGDTVAFNQGFIDRHSRHTASVATAHGRVKALHSVKDVILADIEWNTSGLPKRVNIKNLTRTNVPAPRE